MYTTISLTVDIALVNVYFIDKITEDFKRELKIRDTAELFA